MGWNSLEVKPGAKLFKGLSDNPYVICPFILS